MQKNLFVKKVNNSMIKNVIFDLGSVLINNDPSEYIKSLGFSEEKTEALNQALSSDTTWHDKDIGIYDRCDSHCILVSLGGRI